jgi:two-component system, OmpR family, sensor histidine kinase KdpD
VIDHGLPETKSSLKDAKPTTDQPGVRGFGPLFPVAVIRYVWAVIAVVLVTIFGKLLQPLFDQVNIALLFLLPVLVGAVRWGRGPSFLASLLGLLCFDYFFIPPVLSFAVSDIRHVLSFGIFLAVALVTGTLANRLREQAVEARERERRIGSLYALSHRIAAETDLDRLLQTVVDTLSLALGRKVAILVPGHNDRRFLVAARTPDMALVEEKDEAVAEWVFEQRRPAGPGTDALAAAEHIFFPVCSGETSLAVFAISSSPGQTLSKERKESLRAVADLAALSITRVKLAEEAEQARWLAESEKLHTALLNSISHDLRTPLASITGAVTGLLTEEHVYDPGQRRSLLETIKEGAQRMNRFVMNLLDMVSIEGGILRLGREWCDMEDIVGVSLADTRDVLQGHRVEVVIPQGLPLVQVDFILIEHVLINLLENAAKYSSADSDISLKVLSKDKELLVSVTDGATVIPTTERQRVFDKFHRLQSGRNAAGTGLGLAICKGIVEAYGGRIWIEPALGGKGNKFSFTLPLPPEQPHMDNRRESEERDGN